jgi:LysM repeat protein
MKGLIYLAKFIIVLMVFSIVVGCTLPTDNQVPAVPTIPVLLSALPTFTPLSQIIEEVLPTAVIVTDTAIPTQVDVTDAAIPTQVPPPTSTICSPPVGWPVYIVQPGDNLFRIALNHGMATEELQKANCLPTADEINAGQILYVPYTIPPTSIPPTSVPPTATHPEIPTGLKDEISYDPGGPNDLEPCPPPASGEITLSPRVRDTYELCVYGFPLNEQITLKLMAPDGHFVDSKEFQVLEKLGDITIVRIPLWMPVGVPIGSWTAKAQLVNNENVSVTRPFNIERIIKPAINTMPEGEISPLKPETQKCGHYSYSPTSRIVIRGANYTPNAQLPLAFYLFPQNTGKLQLNSAEFIETDGQGDFSTVINIDETDIGHHLVILAVDPNNGDYHRVDGDNDCYHVP